MADPNPPARDETPDPFKGERYQCLPFLAAPRNRCMIISCDIGYQADALTWHAYSVTDGEGIERTWCVLRTRARLPRLGEPSSKL
ncbi:hypothetical protein C8F01DRAFT_1264790 [Mycena amicta]|nr:hypothetical protein C8F01DRAFT_1264790 [Mycena amicta]